MAKLAFRVGDYHVGVQSNSETILEQVASLLAAHSVDDATVPANISIYELGPMLEGARPMYRVYEGCSHVFTTPSPSRAVVAAVGQMERFLPTESPPPGVVGLRALAVVDGEAAVLAPHWLPRRYPSLELSLRRHGIHILSSGPILVDTARGELLVRSLRLVSDGPIGADGDTALHEGSSAQPGRYPLIAWLFDADETGSADLTRARAVVDGLSLATQPLHDVDKLERLAALIRGLEVRALPMASMSGSIRDLMVLSRRT